MLEEIDLHRVRDAFPDLMLTPAKAAVVWTNTTIAMSLGVTGLFITAIALLLRPNHR
jgi:hypothetical protein